MEFPFYVSKVLPQSTDGITILDAASLNVKSTHLSNASHGHYLNNSAKDGLVQIIDQMGEASSIAQGLGATITTYSKFISSGDNRLYIKTENNRVYGILKMGKRNLFYYDSYGRVKELKPMCVLDFYVHESAQRSGIGKVLFEKMLEYERIDPSKLAYDRPSPKLISFLKKHYGLSKFIPQNNNFVIFDQYWEDSTSNTQSSKAKGYQPMEDNRERKFYPNNAGSQRSFHNVGKSIIENSHMSSLTRNDSLGYSKNDQVQPKSRENVDKYDYDYTKASRNNMSYNPSDSRLKANEEAYYQGGYQSYNTTTAKPVQSYQPKAPWGNYGSEDEGPYKSSSLAYGSHYTRGNLGYGRK